MAKKTTTKDIKSKKVSEANYFARQFRESLTRVVSPVVKGTDTQAKQWGRWTP